jgi:hypothetical protein
VPQYDPDDPEYEKLYDLPVEELGLSETTLQLVMQTGITSIGDCLDYFLRGHDGMITAPMGFIKTMEIEVKAKLKQAGYLPSEG